MPTIADYPDAVMRVMAPKSGDEVPDDATDRDQVYRALLNRDSARVDEQQAAEVADAVLTSDMVRDAIESTGEIPNQDLIDKLSKATDEYGMSGRQDEVSANVSDEVATREDISDAIRNQQPTTDAEVADAVQSAGDVIGGSTQDVVEDVVTVEDVQAEIDPGRTDDPVFASDVREAAQSMAEDSEYTDPSTVDDIADNVSREVGAPTESEFTQEVGQQLISDQVTPREVLGEDATEVDGVGDALADQGIPVIRDTDGEVVATAGPGSSGEAVAEELGVDNVTPNEARESFELEQESGSAKLSFEGRTVGEVDVA